MSSRRKERVNALRWLQERPDLCERLMAGEDAEAIAAELSPRLGRPPGARVDLWEHVRRSVVAHAIYQGSFPSALCPEDLRDVVELAKGSRERSDDAAASLLFQVDGDESIDGNKVEDSRRMVGPTRNSDELHPLGRGREVPMRLSYDPKSGVIDMVVEDQEAWDRLWPLTRDRPRSVSIAVKKPSP